MKKRGMGNIPGLGKYLSTRRRHYQMMTVTSKDELTFMSEEFQRLMEKVQREEDDFHLRLVVDNSKGSRAEFMDE